MPSDFNHIDDFFRTKVQEAAFDTSTAIDKHWQQMKQELASPVKTKMVRTSWTRLWQAAAGVLSIALAVVLLNGEEKRVPVTAINNINNVPDRPAVAGPFIRENTVAAGHQPSSLKNMPVREAPSPLFTSGRQNPEISVQEPGDPVITVHDAALLLEEFLDGMKQNPGEYLINTSADTVIRCPGGTILYIPAFAFSHHNKPVGGMVRLQVKEFYNIADIFSHKLSTLSGDRLLETGGMLHIQAFSGDEPVGINSNNPLTVNIPARKFTPGMQLFRGVETAGETGMQESDTASGIDWLEAGQHQFLQARDRYITVLDLTSPPRTMVVRGKKRVARYVIPGGSEMTPAEVKAILEKRNAGRYDEVRVRRQWFLNKSNPTDDYTDHMPNSHFIADSMRIRFEDAIRLGLLSREDSIRWEEFFRGRAASDNQLAEYRQLRDGYSFRIDAAGWINCDRFLAMPPKSLGTLAVNTGEEFRDSYLFSMILFRKLNVLMQGTRKGDEVIFPNIPRDEEVIFISVGIRNGKTYAVISNMKAGGSLRPVYMETTPEQFREKLLALGSVITRG